jgi:hypothetical protein
LNAGLDYISSVVDKEHFWRFFLLEIIPSTTKRLDAVKSTEFEAKDRYESTLIDRGL